MFNIKENGWYLNGSNQLFIYYGNGYLEQELTTDDNAKVFNFIKNFKYPMEKNEIRKKCPFLNNDQFEDLFSYFLSKKWIYKIDKPIKKNELRLSRFIDAYPNLTFEEYRKISKDVTVLILGLGTGGSYLIEVLSKLGINNFIIVDGDIVEEKNIAVQNYSKEDIGKYKVNVIQKKYSKSVNVEIVNKKIESYEQLKSLTNLKNVDFFVNCADDFNLQIDLMRYLFIDYPKIKMTYGGYSFLLHSDDLITKNNYLQLTNNAIEDKESVILGNYISENSGSIFNGFISAFSISKIIFNCLIKNKRVNFVGNLFLDEYNLSDSKERNKSYE